MPNQYVNKVQFGDTTIMDITDTTAEAADVIEGEVFYTKSGTRSIGTLGNATTAAAGLMSSEDKVKLDSISASAAVIDVKIGSSSIVSSGIATIPVRNNIVSGSTDLVTSNGINSAFGAIFNTTDAQIQGGTQTSRAISPVNQHKAVFYGLSKVAGVDLKNETVTLGIYPDASKAAIQNMLGITSLFSTEEFSTATTAHTTNSLFMMDGKLMRSTTAIAVGDSVTTANCEVVKADEVFAKTTDMPVVFGTGVASVKTADFTIADNFYSNTSSGIASYAFGFHSIAAGNGSFVTGSFNAALGGGSSALGQYNVAAGTRSLAEGYGTIAVGTAAHAEGRSIYATITLTGSANATTYSYTCNYTPEIGDYIYANNKVATISGTATGTITVNATFVDALSSYEGKLYKGYASGDSSHVEGVGTIAASAYQHAQGKYNVKDASSTYADIVGNGTAYDSRANAYTLDWSGNARFAGNVYVGCNADSTSGTMLPYDIQVNGTSIVNNGVANIPIATSSTPGVIKVNPNGGLQMTGTNNNVISIASAGSAAIKLGSAIYLPIAPVLQHEVVFYGLSKVAGVDLANETVTVGTYPTAAKTAIKSMLDISEPSSIIDDTVGNGTTNKVWSADKVYDQLDLKAPKDSPVFINSINLGRKDNTTIGVNSIAFGSLVEASGRNSHAYGNQTIASGDNSYAEGYMTKATGASAHAEGTNTEANGTYSKAEGAYAKANAIITHAEGFYTIADGAYSHVAGKYNIADDNSLWNEWTANTSYVIGDKVKVTTTVDNTTKVTGYICKIANNDSTFTRTNWQDAGIMNYVEIIGNGTSINDRSNARVLDWDGNERLKGYLYVGCNADSTSGTRLPHDIQINEISIISNGIANIPIASTSNLGVVKINTSAGIQTTSDGTLSINRATDDQVKAGTNGNRPLAPGIQHNAVFYGLAKAAGDTSQSSSDNAIGTYTSTAKTAIQEMLGVQAAIEVIRL